jgi:hypothetical protein
VTLLYVGNDVCVFERSDNMLSSKSRIFQGKSITFQEKTMTKLRKMSTAVVLALMLAPSALAGITDYPPAPAPPPPSLMTTRITDTPPGTAQIVDTATNPIVDLALNLLQGALSLF